MTGPEQTPAPSVSTAPAEGASSSAASPRAPLGRRRLPAHIGPARTSTVLLAIAFVAIGVLYLFVKPPETRTAGVGTDPTPTTSRSVAPTTPQETSAPEGTAVPTSDTAPTTDDAPDEGTVEETGVPTTAEPTTTAPTTAEGTTSAPAPGTSTAPPTTEAPSS